MRSVRRFCRGSRGLEGSSLLRIVIPFTSANACICQWRGNAPLLSPRRCKGFADALKVVALKRLCRLPMQLGRGVCGVLMQTQGMQEVTREHGRSAGTSDRLASTGFPEPPLSKRSATAGNQDPLFLFACHVEWHHQRNLRAYQSLVAGLDASDKRIRAIAETMLHRCSPRPQREGRGVYRK